MNELNQKVGMFHHCKHTTFSLKCKKTAFLGLSPLLKYNTFKVQKATILNNPTNTLIKAVFITASFALAALGWLYLMDIRLSAIPSNWSPPSTSIAIFEFFIGLVVFSTLLMLTTQAASKPKVLIVTMAFCFVMSIAFIIRIPMHNKKVQSEKMMQKNSDRIRYGRYTVAKILEESDYTSNYSRNGVRQVFKQLKIAFPVMGQQHFSSIRNPRNSYSIPSRYFLKYSAQDPDNVALYPILVPDSLGDPPEQGWEHIPGTSFGTASVENVNLKTSVVTVRFSFKNRTLIDSVYAEGFQTQDIGTQTQISFYPANPEEDIVIYKNGKGD
jgi:hypothetical protein